jgi:proline iminopeptidase
MLVVHGGPGFMTMPQVVSDFAAGRPVYFYDQLGSGKSDRASEIDYYSVNNFVEELDEVRWALQLAEVILMGFSWGCGLVTSYVLDKGLKGIQGLILSGPLLSTQRWDRDQQDNIARMPQEMISAIRCGEKNKDYGREYQAAMMEYYKRHLCNLEPWPDYVQEALDNLNMDVYMSMWGPSEFTVSGKLKDFELYQFLHKITVPVLLTCGDRDEAGVKTLKDFQMEFPNAQMAVIPKASHLHQIEQPGIYKAIVSEFLKDK